MNSNHVFLAITAGLLTVAENRLADALGKAAEFCRLDASELETGVGAVVRHGNGQHMPLQAWVEARRAEHLVNLFVVTPRNPGHAANEDEDEDEDHTDADTEADISDDERPPYMNTQPVIPDDLKDVFGPDEEERRRLHFRGRLQHDLGWRICQVSRPTMFYVLDRIEGAVPINPAPPLNRSRPDFIAALRAIRDFARRVDSPFVDAFDFALHLAVHAEGDGEPDLAGLRRSDPDRSSADWQTVDRFNALFAPFGWGANRLLGLAAISAADVFGAMGSWNDQGFEGDDDVTFHSVSGQLFGALNRYFDAIVSFQT